MKFIHHRSIYRMTRAGYSLLELIAVVGITLALSSIVILGFGRRSKNVTALYVEGAKLVEVILRAKSLAISTYNIPPIPCGYGVKIDRSTETYSLVVYNYLANDPECVNIRTLPLNTARLVTFTPTGGTPETYKLNENIRFANSSPGQTIEYLIFVPPDPKTYLYLTNFFGGAPAPPGFAGLISLRTNPASIQFTINVNHQGQVSSL